jgi:hypothetical protein
MPILVLGILLFFVAILVGENVVYGIADILIGVAIGMYAAQGAPPGARSPSLYVGGLAVASVAAILDGLLTMANQTGGVTTVLTLVVVAGAVVSLVGWAPARR